MEPWTHLLLLRIGLTVGFIAAALLIRFVLLSGAGRWLSRRGFLAKAPELKPQFGAPLNPLIFSLLTTILFPLYQFSDRTEANLTHASQIVLIFSVTWFLIRLTSFIEATLYSFYDVSVTDNFRQRRARTQIQYVTRVILIVIGILGFATVLLSFQGARQFGASLIASAGVASVVIGLAAQKSLSNLFAGFQIAFTQPVRIDDVVIVEKEWGRVEEITLTYVVVKLWDLRRMVLPITYFVEKPFENWTRSSSEILGYTFLKVDYGMPIDPLRTELRRILENSTQWMRKLCLLQVTDTSEKTIELRTLFDCPNASDAFDLRCEVREKMMAFMQREYPQFLPCMRVDANHNDFPGFRMPPEKEDSFLATQNNKARGRGRDPEIGKGIVGKQLGSEEGKVTTPETSAPGVKKS